MRGSLPSLFALPAGLLVLAAAPMAAATQADGFAGLPIKRNSEIVSVQDLAGTIIRVPGQENGVPVSKDIYVKDISWGRENGAVVVRRLKGILSDGRKVRYDRSTELPEVVERVADLGPVTAACGAEGRKERRRVLTSLLRWRSDEGGRVTLSSFVGPAVAHAQDARCEFLLEVRCTDDGNCSTFCINFWPFGCSCPGPGTCSLKNFVTCKNIDCPAPGVCEVTGAATCECVEKRFTAVGKAVQYKTDLVKAYGECEAPAPRTLAVAGLGQVGVCGPASLSPGLVDRGQVQLKRLPNGLSAQVKAKVLNTQGPFNAILHLRMTYEEGTVVDGTLSMQLDEQSGMGGDVKLKGKHDLIGLTGMNIQILGVEITDRNGTLAVPGAQVP